MAKGPPDRTKVVIRKLPPTLPSADLKAAIDGKCDGQYNAYTFVPGKSSTKAVKHARAYLYFKDPLQVYDFRAAFDGHIFVNEKGAQFRCSVEYAPYQGVPKKSSKKDPREGTLETDAEYLEFLATLDKEPELLPSADKQVSEARDAPQKKRVTPLMQFLHDKWTGKHHISAPKQPQSRQRRKTKDTDSNLPPPPGFDALPKSGGKPPKGKARQSSKSSPAEDKQGLEAAQEAVAAALQGVELITPTPSQTSAKEKTSKRRSRKDSSEQDEGSKPAQAKAPTRILKKDQDQTEDPSAEPESKPRRERAKQRSKPPKEDATEAQEQAATRTAPSRPVRVRAGFQVYTPRSRAQPGETPAAKDSVAPARSQAADGAEEVGGQSWDTLINAPAEEDGTFTPVNGASMPKTSPGQDAGSEPPQGSEPPRGSSEGQPVSQADANEIAQPPEQTGDQLSEGRTSSSRGRGGRRNWRRADGVTEPGGG